MIYLDANASEPLRPQARAALLSALDLAGNPASPHHAGQAARRLLDRARARLGQRFGLDPNGVVFTSGGTEADVTAIRAFGAGRRIVVGATEHAAILSAAPDAARIPVDRNGVADLAALDAVIAERPALVCLMLANNEVGTIQPIEEAAAICRRRGALLHVDAVQAAGRMRVDVTALGADSVAVSSHKLGGPMGAGALLLRDGGDIAPLIAGGGQERGRRGGTPALAAIAGFAAAAEVQPQPLDAMRDAAERAALAVGAVVCGAGAPRLANTACIALPGVAAMTQVMALDLAGIAVSAGSACSAGVVAESHVLRAMGLGKLAHEAIRVSLPWNATDADIAGFAEAYATMAMRCQRLVAA